MTSLLHKDILLSVNMFPSLAVVVVCLVTVACWKTILDSESQKDGKEGLYFYKCIKPDSPHSRTDNCSLSIVCCWRLPLEVDLLSNIVAKDNTIRHSKDSIKATKGDTKYPNVPYPDFKPHVERGGDTEEIIVNVALIKDTISTPTTTKVASIRAPGDDGIVFSKNYDQQEGNSTKHFKWFNNTFTMNNYNSTHRRTTRPANGKTIGTKSAKYCKLYEKYYFTLELGLGIRRQPSWPPILLSNTLCSKPLPLIVGGVNTTKGEFPHMASLGYDRGEWIDFLCGGSLISANFVLTAAHCCNTKLGPPIMARLGTRNLITDVGQNCDVEKVIVHPGYQAPCSYNDIALLKLKEELKFTKTLRPACLPLPTSTSGDPGNRLTATGRGRTGYGLFSSPTLQKVPLVIIENKICEQQFLGDRRTERLPQGIVSSMLCASGFLDSSHDTCQGDSGGPIQVHTSHSKCMHEIVGITSFGKLCGTGLPAIYTRVSSYIGWIEEIVWPS